MAQRPVASISWMAAAMPRPTPGSLRSARGPCRVTISPISSGNRAIVSAAPRKAHTRKGFACCCSRSWAASCSQAVIVSFHDGAARDVGRNGALTAELLTFMCQFRGSPGRAARAWRLAAERPSAGRLGYARHSTPARGAPGVRGTQTSILRSRPRLGPLPVHGECAPHWSAHPRGVSHATVRNFGAAGWHLRCSPLPSSRRWPVPQIVDSPLDALLPPEMARRAEEIGAAKVSMDHGRLMALAILAGAFIALGGIFSTVALAGTSGAPWGPTRVLAGLVFCEGLVLVVVGGAELFTGNNLIVMAWAGGRVRTSAVLASWAIVYAGNFAGGLGVALAVYGARLHEAGGGSFGTTALEIAAAKLHLGFGEAALVGVVCNALVCLAVWLSYSARSTTDRALVVVPPIAA